MHTTVDAARRATGVADFAGNGMRDLEPHSSSSSGERTSWPDFLVRPRATRFVILVQLSSRCLWIAEVERLHFLGPDDDDPEVRSRGLIVEVVHFFAEFEMLIVVGFVHLLSWRWGGECA